MAVTKIANLAYIGKCPRFVSRAPFAFLLLLLSLAGNSAVLPEDRADILLHHYEGDNSTFNGPSVLVRKQFKETVSVWGNYYVDMNSAASVDVMTQGSPYEEDRVQTSIGLDYLHNKTILSVGLQNSSENDYEADNVSFSLSQDFFGDLSTFSLNYSKGDDEIFQNIRNGSGKNDITGRTLEGEAQHQRFGLGWTQVLTKNWIVALKAEAVLDEGFLKNPYRSFRTTSSPIEDSYPTTRNSEAYALTSMYYLPWRAAFKFNYRDFNDSWQIKASNYELKYIHPIGENWILDLRYRHYEQSNAYFYFDILDFAEFEFYARDKELSTFQNNTFGMGLTYELPNKWIGFVDKTTINFFADTVAYKYDNFRDASQSTTQGGSFAPGEEPAFSFNAQIIRFFVSFWY